MNSPHTHSDSEDGKKRRRKGARADGENLGPVDAQADEQMVAQGWLQPQGEEVAYSPAIDESVAASASGDGPVTTQTNENQSAGVRSRADRNPRGAQRLRVQPMRIANSMAGSESGSRRSTGWAGASWGWMRWGLLLPVVGFTGWVAAGILTHGWNGQWRSEESHYRIDTGQASGASAGRSGDSAAKIAAENPSELGLGPAGAQGKEPAWKNPAKWTDSFGDGTPDFLRLNDATDREAFRQWFVLIADYQAMRPAATVPKEITDCASLLRYAYREALKKHDPGWFKDTGMEVGALPGEMTAWHYPDTPLETGLFRVTPGPFVQGDESDGAFAQFADAKTLVERNAYLVSRNVFQAEPGDLLFYRQFGQSSPWHSMIVTKVGSGAAVVYDTGEDHGAAGELRRVELTDLLAHPQPEWRPLSSNPNFMGVYRWNILRGSL